MITVLTGDNSFEVSRALAKIERVFDGTPEKVDGSTLELKQLPDLIMGGTLFASTRLVVIKNLSENKSVWTDFSAWLPRVSDDVQLVLVEPKLDKRTKTYKDLQQAAIITEYKAWTERDTAQAEQWVAGEAKAMSFDLDRELSRLLVQRVGVDQWLLHQALQKLAVLDNVTPEVISDVIEANPVENVFNLFESALKGNTAKISAMIRTLELTEDPFRLFGLLSGQAFQLAVLANAEDMPSADVAKDIGVHPYGLSKLAPYARKLGKSGAKKVITNFAEADHEMKSSSTDPWLLIERALMKVTQL